MLVLALVGVLLLVIAIPTGKNEKQDKNAENRLDQGSSLSGYERLSETYDAQNTSDDLSDNAAESERYAAILETRLESFLAGMDGVGKVDVMITLSASRELVVEKDIPSDIENITETDSLGGVRETFRSVQQEETIYLTDSDGTKTPYVIMTREPKVEGVTVAAEGGGNGIIQKNITEVIEALFDLDVHKIRVVKMK